MSRIRYDDAAIMPPYVNLNDLRLGLDSDDREVPRYMGPAHGPFRPTGPGLANLRLPDVGISRRHARLDYDGSQVVLTDLGSLVRGLSGQAGSALTLGRRIAGPLLRPGRHPDLVDLPRAPRSILNRRIGRNRRLATQQYDLAHLKQLGAEHGATINDVMLALVAGGLRAFLDERNELPSQPLVAFLPVNVRPRGDEGGGNAVGAILATLATDVADPVERLQRITASTRAAKAQLEGMSQGAILAYSAYLLAPAGFWGHSAEDVDDAMLG